MILLATSSHVPPRCIWGLKHSSDLGAVLRPKWDVAARIMGGERGMVVAVLLGLAARSAPSLLGDLLRGQCHLGL